MANQSWGVYAWAQQVVFNPHTQLYTMFYPGMGARSPPASNATGTGVATSASPTGPFEDALGHPILPCGDDPTVFIDDDGTIVLCGEARPLSLQVPRSQGTDTCPPRSRCKATAGGRSVASSTTTCCRSRLSQPSSHRRCPYWVRGALDIQGVRDVLHELHVLRRGTKRHPAGHGFQLLARGLGYLVRMGVGVPVGWA